MNITEIDQYQFDDGDLYHIKDLFSQVSFIGSLMEIEPEMYDAIDNVSVITEPIEDQTDYIFQTEEIFNVYNFLSMICNRKVSEYWANKIYFRRDSSLTEFFDAYDRYLLDSDIPADIPDSQIRFSNASIIGILPFCPTILDVVSKVSGKVNPIGVEINQILLFDPNKYRLLSEECIFYQVVYFK
jgi:hypothetical protein